MLEPSAPGITLLTNLVSVPAPRAQPIVEMQSFPTFPVCTPAIGRGGAGFANRNAPTGGAAKRIFLKMYIWDQSVIHYFKIEHFYGTSAS